MKRVKMIVTSVVVLAIVGSAFAFNAKKIGIFCVTNKVANQDCYIIYFSKRTTGSGTSLIYYTNWDGSVASCTTGANTCNTLAKFTPN
jgi:hypothetical protein